MKHFLVILLLLLWLPWAAILADAPGRTAFPGSLAPVPPSAHDLTASQPVAADERVSFQIALRLPPDGKAPEAAYASLAQWLREQGLTVTASDPAFHSLVEVSGTVAQVGKALEMHFGRVEIGGRVWVAAVSAPSLPAALSSAVTGVNGLQPFKHMNKGPVFVRPAEH